MGCCNENGELAVLSAVDVGSLRPGLVQAVGCQMPLRAEEAEDGESVSRRLDCAGGWGGGYTALRKPQSRAPCIGRPSDLSSSLALRHVLLLGS